MIKTFFAIILLTFSSLTFSQELKSLSKIVELDSIKESAKGKVILFNFWATWCKPCVKEFPELLKLREKYAEKGFELVFVSLDDLSEIDSKLKPFLSKNKVDFMTYYSSFEKPETLIDYFDKKWEGAIPSTYIYDKEGTLKVKILGNRSYEDFEKEIKPLL